MSIERFIKDGDSNFITITGGTDTGEILKMSGDMKEHHIAIRFKDGSGADIVPTAGTIRFQGSQFRTPLYEEIQDGFFNAADINDPLRIHPIIGGPVRAFKVTLIGIAGAATAYIKVTSF